MHDEGAPAGLKVVVLSSGTLGLDVARRLSSAPGIGAVTVVTAPGPRPRSLKAKLRRVYRTQGWLGFAGVAWAKVRHLAGVREPVPAPKPPPPGVQVLRFGDFHEPTCIAAIQGLAPDLGVVAGTGILRPPVFEIPRLGSINLHTGKVPDYRGAAPGFWELYNGETSVGITIHRVTAELDAGAILAEDAFPLEPAPEEDPLTYLERYRADVLLHHGVRMLVEVVVAIAGGTVQERPQAAEGATTRRSPDHKAVRELRRRVAARRRARLP